MPDDFREKLEQLVSEFKATLDQTPDVGHDEIHHVFVRRLLGPELLGWPMDVNAYRIEHPLPQEAGIPDGMIHWQANPLIAIEVKRPN